MRGMLFTACLLVSGAALAEPTSAALVLVPEHHPVKDKSRFEGVFTGMLDAAGLGISSGHLVLVRRDPASGRREPVGVAVGNARLEPLFDVGVSHAGALLRLAF